MNQSFWSVTEKPHWCMSLSNNSILVRHSFMLISSFIVPFSSLHVFSNNRYKGVGSKWMNGRCEQSLLLQICWCPPKGICHAGNPTNSTPFVFINFLRCARNGSFVGTCSITSCNSITSYLSSSLHGTGYCMKSLHTNVAWLLISEKYALASLILHSAISIPVTLQPNCAKGTKFPPSPQPTSKILLFGVSSVKSDK